MAEHPILFSGPMINAILDGKKTQTRRYVKPLHLFKGSTSPYGVAGEVLWCRETHYRWTGCNSAPKDFVCHRSFPMKLFQQPDCRCYADHPNLKEMLDACVLEKIPSIFMTRWACRLLLDVVNVRVERLRDITTEDIIAEGGSTALREHDAECDLREKFAQLWDSINGKKTGRTWADDPWVWVIEFKKRDHDLQ